MLTEFLFNTPDGKSICFSHSSDRFIRGSTRKIKGAWRFKTEHYSVTNSKKKTRQLEIDFDKIKGSQYTYLICDFDTLPKGVKSRAELADTLEELGLLTFRSTSGKVKALALIEKPMDRKLSSYSTAHLLTALRSFLPENLGNALDTHRLALTRSFLTPEAVERLSWAMHTLKPILSLADDNTAHVLAHVNKTRLTEADLEPFKEFIDVRDESDRQSRIGFIRYLMSFSGYLEGEQLCHTYVAKLLKVDASTVHRYIKFFMKNKWLKLVDTCYQVRRKSMKYEARNVLADMLTARWKEKKVTADFSQVRLPRVINSGEWNKTLLEKGWAYVSRLEEFFKDFLSINGSKGRFRKAYDIIRFYYRKAFSAPLPMSFAEAQYKYLLVGA